MEIRLPYQWSPRPYQRALWEYLRNGGLHAVVCAHRRWGKDDVCLHHTACAMFERRGNYGHMLPEYAQGRKAIWDAINPHTGKKRIDEAFPLEIRKSSGGTNDQEMKIVSKPDGSGNVSTWQVLGSDMYNSLMGTAYAGLVKSEEALSNPGAIGYLSPIMRENHGWMLHISTPRGRNHFHALLETAYKTAGWYGELAPADKTGVFTEAELQEELQILQDLHGADYGYALWLQEYFCSFDAAIPGSIWGDCVRKAEESGRVLDFEVNTAQPVFTAWDLGRTDDTAIWWYQLLGKQIDILDHHSSSLKDMPFYMDLLEQKRNDHAITYATHHLPHDARPRTLAAGGKSILQQCHDAARDNPHLGRFVIGKRLDVQEGIQAARGTFPHTRFHKTRTAKGLNSLRQYHREWDDEKKVFRDVPEHDWCLAGDSLVLTPIGWKPINSLAVHDKVLTPSGIRAILRTGIVRWTNEWTNIQGISCTKEHQFFTNRGLVKAEDVSPRDALWTRGSWGLRILACWSAGLRFGLKDAITSATHEARKNQQNAIACSFIEWCMRLCMVRFRQIMKSITLMMTHSITIQRTCAPNCNSFIAATISPSHAIVARVSSADGSSGTIIPLPTLAQGRARQYDISSSNENDAPAYNLTVEHDHCYFVRGADSKAYLVANSSHDADAFRGLALSWKFANPGQVESPLVDRLLAANPSTQTFGSLMKRHLEKRRRARQDLVA